MVQLVMRNLSFFPFIFLFIFLQMMLGGCLGRHTPAAQPQPSAGTGNTLTNHVVIQGAGNFTFLLPVSFEGDVVMDGHADKEGPRGSGLEFALIRSDGTIVPYFGLHETPEFSKRKSTTDLRSTYREECWDGRIREHETDIQCTQRLRPGLPFPNTQFNSEPDELVGNAYFLMIGHLVDHVEFRLDFNRPVLVGELVREPHHLQLVALESFEGSYVEMNQCIDIGWCGALIGGRYQLELQGNRSTYVSAHGIMHDGTYLYFCLESDGGDKICPTPAAGATGIGWYLRRGFVPGDPHKTFQLDMVAGAATTGVDPAVGDLAGLTADRFGAWIAQFDLPAQHPLAT